jgi:hypothetical protein
LTFVLIGHSILRYYGPSHGQSVCATCHAFLYANDLDAEVNVQLASVERDGETSDSDRDSGNDEPNDYFYAARGAAANNVERQQSREDQNPDADQADQGANFVRFEDQGRPELDEEDPPLIPMYKGFMCKMILSRFKILPSFKPKPLFRSKKNQSRIRCRRSSSSSANSS